jgi:biopolymer transport protein ExbD
LLDVVLQLIAFFLMLVHFGAQLEGADPSVRLPEASAALPGEAEAADRLLVAIGPDGRLRPPGATEGLEPGAAAAWWRDEAERRRREGVDVERIEVVVRADRGSRYGTVRALLARGQEAGFRRFSLVVLREVR